MKNYFALSAAALATFAMPASAIAQQADCVSRAESRAVTANLLPPLLKSTAKRCTPKLGNGSYLATNADRLADRLTPIADRNLPATVSAIERIGGNPLPNNPALIEFGRAAIADGITKEFSTETCDVVDRLTRELAPLPPENFVNVFALFLQAGIDGSEQSPLKVCKAERS
ncbi:hypothetical protein HME9302_01760 [Alteripontixanthobacter maritimus]|uniref:Secreted protein n=1 Tax=Alteripontixanthobacter maritimus TaxID=2161824 RepID=A0A369QCB3_9SPHN|nr:hypothetical protein [Alteripontixanthobacter maritimus]RDC60549.1 hypothetical protein HME9302_01760 [Alteripontixanthobacter maritimus]